MPGTFVPNPSQLAAFFASPQGPIARDVARRAQRVRDQAVVNASGRPGPRVRTNRLRSSIRWFLIAGGPVVYAVVGTNVYYARFVEHGTEHHTIQPRNRRALYWTGAAYPVRIVQHPGSRPYPFLRPALTAGLGTTRA
jgi:Bacteriophage HK97-gp10, putative tail-component